MKVKPLVSHATPLLPHFGVLIIVADVEKAFVESVRTITLLFRSMVSLKKLCEYASPALNTLIPTTKKRKIARINWMCLVSMLILLMIKAELRSSWPR